MYEFDSDAPACVLIVRSVKWRRTMIRDLVAKTQKKAEAQMCFRRKNLFFNRYVALFAKVLGITMFVCRMSYVMFLG